MTMYMYTGVCVRKLGFGSAQKTLTRSTVFIIRGRSRVRARWYNISTEQHFQRAARSADINVTAILKIR